MRTQKQMIIRGKQWTFDSTLIIDLLWRIDLHAMVKHKDYSSNMYLVK